MKTTSAQKTMRKSVELCAGAGGLSLGLAQSGFTPHLLVEHNTWCCNTLRENMQTPWQVLEDDIRQVDFTQFEGSLDLISGGPPCQPFSLGGQGRAYNDARDLFPQAVRALREARPKAFVFENVKGLMRASFQNYFEYIQYQMEHPDLVIKTDEHWQDHLARLKHYQITSKRPGLHYRVVTRLLNAANYGVPQKRERVFFVGFRDDVGARWSFETGKHSQEALVWDQTFGDYWDRHKIAKKDQQLTGRAVQISRKLSRNHRPTSIPWATTRDAIADLPDPRHVKQSESVFNHRFQEGARVYPGHTGSYLEEPAKTLKAGVHGVPGGENMLRRANGTVRYFSTREAARLQTFPDSYKFHGAWSESMRQLGNAVPVKLAQVIGDSLAQQLSASA